MVADLDYEFTDEVLAQIARLREEVGSLLSPKYDSDFVMYRWLLGNHFDFDQTLHLLRTHLYWRKYLKFDEGPIDVDPNNILTEYLPIHGMGPTGVDEGRTFGIELLGLEDYVGFVDAVGPMDSITHRWRQSEHGLSTTVREYEARTGKFAGYYAIVDMKGIIFSTQLFTTCTSIYPKMLHLVGAHYPEGIIKIFVVNAPSAISTLMAMLRPFLPQRTKDKMEFVSCSSQIHKVIHPSRLPIQYGGTLVDENGDPECKLIVKPPPTPKIPEHVYNNVNAGCPTIEKMTKLTANAGKIGESDLNYESDAKTITLFMRLASDVRLSVEMTDKNDNTDYCIPPTPFPAHPNVYKLDFDVTEKQTYKLIMDNSHAWLKSVSLHYACESKK